MKYPTLYTTDGRVHQTVNREYFGGQPDGALALKFNDAVSEEEWISDTQELSELKTQGAPLAYTVAGCEAMGIPILFTKSGRPDARPASLAARNAAMTPAERSERARKGGEARWARPKHLADRYLEAVDNAWGAYRCTLTPEQWGASAAIAPENVAIVRDYLTARGVL